MNGYEIKIMYALYENIDNLLNGSKLIKRTFTKDEVTFLYVLSETEEKYLLPELKKVSNNLVKIKKLEYIVDDFEVGTDKPIGSKDAIDEN